MYSSPQRMTGLSQLYGALEYKQREKLAKEAEEERRREIERQRKQQEAANKHSAFGANLQAIGTIGGSIAGAFIGGPAGAAAGASLGSALASGTMAVAPNIGGTQPDASNAYYQPASDLQRGATALQSGLQVWSTYENQIREPWLRKAGNATRGNTYKHFQEGSDVAATQKYMSPQEGSKFSQSMIDAGYNADNLPWYITEDDIVNLQNEQYLTFNETIAPIGQTAKIDIENDVLMVGETMGRVGLDHIRELTLRKTAKERMAYLEEQGADNPHLRSIAEQPTWLINQGWAKGRELRNLTDSEEAKAFKEKKELNRVARTKQIDYRYKEVMEQWTRIQNTPREMQLAPAYQELAKAGVKMNADTFTKIYAEKYGLGSGYRPEMYYDVLRVHAGGDAQEYFSTSTLPKVQQAYQLYLAQEEAGTLYSQTGGVAQDQSSATSKKKPSEPQGEVAQQADTTTLSNEFYVNPQEQQAGYAEALANRDDSPETFTPSRPNPRNKDAGPQEPLLKAGSGMKGTPRARTQTASPESEIESGYDVADVKERTRVANSLRGLNNELYFTEEEEAAENQAVSAKDNLGNRYPVSQTTTSPRPINPAVPPAPDGFGMSPPAPMRTENDAVMKRMEKSLRQTNAVPGGGTLDPAKDADTNPVPVRRVGELETGRPVFEDQLGRRYSEMPEVVEAAEGFVVAPTVDLQGEVRDVAEITKRVNQTLATEGAPLDDFTGKQLPYFNTVEEAETYRDQRKEAIGETVPSASTYQRNRDRAIGGVDPMDQINEQLREGRENPIPEWVGTPAAPTNATLRNLIENTPPPPAAPDSLEAKPTRTTGRQVRTTQGLIDEANRDVTMDARQEDQSRKAADRWASYQKRKAELIGKEEAKVQPIQKGKARPEEPIQDKGTTKATLGDGFYTKGGRFKPGEYEKVMAAQDRDNATEARMDAVDDLRYDPRQDRASEFREAPATVPNRLQNEGYPFEPPEEKSLRDAIIEGFPATERDNLTGIMDQIIALESDGDETAESAAGATGILQLMPGTVEQLMGKDADASDDDTYVAAANKLFTKNSSLLERNGYSINALNMYVLHHFGAGGKKLLDADSDTLVKDVKYYNVVSKKDTPLIQQREVNANPWINSAAEINQKTWEDLTVGEFLEYLEQAVNNGDFPQPDPQVIAAANNAKVL